VYRVENQAGGEHWYLIHRGHLHAVLATPHDRSSQQAALARIEAVFDRQASWMEPTTPEQLDGVLLVASWFRRHPEEYARTLTPTEVMAKRARRN